MAALPNNYDVVAGFVAARPADVFAQLRELENWPSIFAGWIERVESDDDRWSVTGPARERYDFYPNSDVDARTLDVEVVDELGSSDTIRIRVLDMPGGSLVIAAHGQLAGTSDAAWQQKRDAVNRAVLELSID